MICPYSMANPKDIKECIEEDCRAWVKGEKYKKYTHPEYYMNPQPNPKPPGFYAYEEGIKSGYCRQFG